MLTDNTTDFQNTEVTISVAVLLSATSNITGNMNVRISNHARTVVLTKIV